MSFQQVEIRLAGREGIVRQQGVLKVLSRELAVDESAIEIGAEFAPQQCYAAGSGFIDANPFVDLVLRSFRVVMRRVHAVGSRRGQLQHRDRRLGEPSAALVEPLRRQRLEHRRTFLGRGLRPRLCRSRGVDEVPLLSDGTSLLRAERRAYLRPVQRRVCMRIASLKAGSSSAITCELRSANRRL